MKNVFFIMFCFISTVTIAQSTDTIFVQWVNGKAYMTQRVAREDGSYSENSYLVGDTANLVNYTKQILADAAYRLNEAAQAVIKSNRYWAQAASEDQKFQLAYGVSPLTELQQQVDGSFIEKQWVLESSTTVNITFDRNANGKLRVNGIGSTAKIVDLVQGCMRIRNFNADGPMNFYKANTAGTIWVNSERTHTIKLATR